MTYVGTANYVSKFHIKHKYCANAQIMIDEGRVIVGKPDIKEGQTLRVDSDGRYRIGILDQKDIQKKEAKKKEIQKKRKPTKKAIYIMMEDPRETGLFRGSDFDNKVFSSLKEACEALIKRVWYFEADHRTWIEEKRKELGAIKAWNDHVASAWLYCPYYVKKFVKVN